MKIQSSVLVKYNANTRGTDTGDCTARSISLAFNINYSKVRKMLYASAKQLHYDSYNVDDNVDRVLYQLGAGAKQRPSKKISVDEFADTHAHGTYIVGCSKSNGTYATHMVCIIDGTVYDSWDSRVYYVDEYWVIARGTKGSDITDVGSYLKEWINSKTAAEYVQYVVDIFNDIIDKNRRLKKLKAKDKVDISFNIEVTKIQLVNYTFNYGGEIYVKLHDYGIIKTFPHKFSIVFKPTMSPDEVQPYFDENFYGKLYPQVQNAIRKVEDICEGYLLTKDAKIPNGSLYMYSYEKKSFLTLPYWVQRLTTFFKAEAPFQEHYHDSIELCINTPPFDSEYGNCEKERKFIAYNMNDLKQGLEYYKKTGDYDRAYDIARDTDW